MSIAIITNGKYIIICQLNCQLYDLIIVSCHINMFQFCRIFNIFTSCPNELPTKGTDHNGQHYDVPPQVDGIVTTITSSHN